MTISKLYYTNPWLQTLETKIAFQQEAGERHLVVLDETIFYPTGGGQPHDLGTINGQPILDVFEREGVIYHALTQPLKDETALCVLDWDRRVDHMQQHSGQHLLSALLADRYDYATESFHLGEKYSSIDISTPMLSAEKQSEIERQANQLIFKDLPLLTYTAEPEALTDLPLRKMPALAGPLRIVEIEGLDYSPCSGTHVEKTGQIGLLTISKAEKYKGMTRVYFLCGWRALNDYRRKQEISTSLISLFSVPEEELGERINQELERKRELEKQLNELQAELLQLKAEAVIRDQKSPFYIYLPKASIEEAQQLAKSVLALTSGKVIINLGERIVLAQNESGSVHLGQLIREYGQTYGGRGGGSATSAQVYFADPKQLQKFLDLLQNKLIE